MSAEGSGGTRSHVRPGCISVTPLDRGCLPADATPGRHIMGMLGQVSIVHVTLGAPRMGDLAPGSCTLQSNSTP